MQMQADKYTYIYVGMECNFLGKKLQAWGGKNVPFF